MIAKLCKIQSALKAPKNQYNKFGEFHYRSCEDILEAVKPLCVAEGLLLTISDEVVVLGDRYYVKAVAKVTDGEKEMSVTAYARESESRPKMDAAQLTGSASSYARKYALNGLFCIDDTKDADTMKPVDDMTKPVTDTTKPVDEKPKAKSKAKAKAPTKAEIWEHAQAQGLSGSDVTEILKRHFGGKGFGSLTEAELFDLQNNLEDYAVEIINDEALMMGEA
ncbi:MAG: ERF family protein [Clostridia bacterium]|nr:ERF family protein [Schwartzia sp. (in: firmicutes)]MBQ9728844.1 ERF family protein [Clostridia bacterium]